jgi:CDP-diacylglycerol--glycerol-3-phosphate 3-phosphatidyltransferase
MHSSLIFAIASLTDYLDGYLARRWDICSPFGAFLDPVADKLMVSTALILLTGKYGYAVAIPSAIILAREIAVSALREWMASKGLRDSVKVGFQGKVRVVENQHMVHIPATFYEHCIKVCRVL